MAMAMALPKYVALKSKNNNKYLRFIHEDVHLHGFLQFSGEELVSPYTKFEIQESKNHVGLVHIKCCYHNKYWVRRNNVQWWIVGTADEVNEDKSSWSCTLFEPVYVDGDAQTVRFRHVQLGRYASLHETSPSPAFGDCLFAGSTFPSEEFLDVYTVIDWESLLVLPKYVAFKGANGKYLSATTINGNPFLQFASNNIGDPTVVYEVFITPEGSVRIKCHHFDKFWRLGPSNWIRADSHSNSNDTDTLYWPVRVLDHGHDISYDVVGALRNLMNNNFCKRLTTQNIISCLNADVPTITDIETQLILGEPVLSRDIFDVQFKLGCARIYDQTTTTLVNQQVTNATNEPITRKLTFSYEDIKSRTWKSSVSLKLNTVKPTTLKSGIPFLSGGNVEMSTEEVSGEYEWGQTVTIKTMVEKEYTVTVPPMTTITVNILVRKGSCDVPFSYTQLDALTLMTNGSPVIVTQNMNDGIFTGTNYFGMEYDEKEEKLPM